MKKPTLKPLIFLGASPAREIVELARDINAVTPSFELLGVLDDDPKYRGTKVDGVPVLGKLDKVRSYPSASFVLCIGAHKSRLTRYAIVQRLKMPKSRYATMIHPTAKVYASSRLGHGCLIHKGAIIFNDIIVEDLVSVLANTVIGARNRLCEGALITSLVVTTADVVIGSYSHIGAGSAIGEGVKIGPGAQVAMGSTVLADVPPGTFAFGNPTRFLNKVSVPKSLLTRWRKLTKSR